MKLWEKKSRKSKMKKRTNAEMSLLRRKRADERRRVYNELKKQMEEAAKRAE